MADYQLAIETRTDTGKGVARKLRAAGRIPGVFYAGGTSPHAIELDPSELEHLITTSSAGMNTLIDLKGGGELDGKLVLVKDVQRDPIGGALLHADLYGVDVTRTIQVSVPVRLIGIPVGVSQDGGIMDHALREVECTCLPTGIPEELRIDVGELALGASLHVRDIPLPEGIEVESNRDLPVVSVVAPRVEEEEKPAEDEEAVEGEGEGEGEGDVAESGEASKGDESKAEG